jgi:hypothetical protein
LLASAAPVASVKHGVCVASTDSGMPMTPPVAVVPDVAVVAPDTDVPVAPVDPVTAEVAVVAAAPPEAPDDDLPPAQLAALSVRVPRQTESKTRTRRKCMGPRYPV